MDIVQDIVRVEQAKTTTGDYQSPNSIAPILTGFSQSLGGLGKGSKETDWTGLYKYMSQRRDEYNSKSMGDSEARDFQDSTFITAYKKFGASASDVNNVASQVGFDLIQERAKEQMKRDKAIKIKNDADIYNAGLEVNGPEATLDSIMSAGAERIASVETAIQATARFGQLTPRQQQEALNRSYLPNFTIIGIREEWNSRSLSEKYNDLPEEAAMLTFKNYQEAILRQKYNVTPTVAKAIVDKAMLPYELTLYGDKVLEDHGLQYYREAADKAYKTDRDIRTEDILSQFMNADWDISLTGGKEVVLKGDQVIALMTEGGSQGSTGGASRILATLNEAKLLPQLAQKIKSRYSYNHMRLLFSPDGADLATILADNKDASSNINDGRRQALQTAINESNNQSDEERRTKDSYFQPQKKFNDSFKLSTGEYISKETFESLKSKETPEETSREIDELLASIASESNAATGKNGFYFLDQKGNLKYYGMVGQRIANLVRGLGKAGSGGNPLVILDETERESAESLRDLTDAGRLIESGDVDAVIMRSNIPAIKENLRILKKYYGLSDAQIRERFNNSQIMMTSGGKRAVSLLAMKDLGIKPGSFIDESFEYRATAQDAQRLADIIDKGEVGEAIGVSEETKETLDAAQFAATGLAKLAATPAVKAGAAIASLTPTARRGSAAAIQAGRVPPEVSWTDALRVAFGTKEVGPKEKIIYLFDIEDPEVVIKEDKGYYSASYTNEDGQLTQTIPLTEKEIDKQLESKYGVKAPESTIISKNSDGSFSIVKEDGTKQGSYKTQAEAFKAAEKLIKVNKTP